MMLFVDQLFKSSNILVFTLTTNISINMYFYTEVRYCVTVKLAPSTAEKHYIILFKYIVEAVKLHSCRLSFFFN